MFQILNKNWQDQSSEEEDFGLECDVGVLPETPLKQGECCCCRTNPAVYFSGGLHFHLLNQ